MSQTLQDYISDYIQSIFKKYPGAWLVWCDPNGDWLPLLQRVNSGKKSFPLYTIDERTAGSFGSPLARKHLNEWIATGTSFILHVTCKREDLGWLSAQALLAEEIQHRKLRQRLREWGWRPQNIQTSDEEIARLARKNLQLPLDEWGGGQIMAEPHMLLEVLAGGRLPWDKEGTLDQSELQDARVVLELTVEGAGLPPIDEQNLERWRLEALAHLLVTQAQQVTPEYFSNHDYLIAADKRAEAINLLERWLDSVRLSKGLPERILNADRILALGSYYTGTELNARPYLSQALERALFANICKDLTTQSGRDLLEALAPLQTAFSRHAKEGFWGDKNDQHKEHPQSLPWSELARLSQAVKNMLNAAPQPSWRNPVEAVTWYSNQGWRIEQAGEEIMRQLKRPTPELLHFITPLREAYAHHWESYLITWSDLWQQAGYPVPHYSSQGAWLKAQLKKEVRATAVIMLDALRYDIGMVLSEKINAREGEVERAKVSPARTAIPSITALGMALALPIDEDQLQAEVVNGKWQMYEQGQSLNLSNAENRRTWLRTQLKIAPEALLTLDKKGSLDIPKASQNGRLFIFDNTLDKLGHDEELEPLGTIEVQDRYIQTIEQLRDKGWMRVLIVTDHGFIHWPDIRERRAPLPLYDPAYSSRRALAYPASEHWKGPQVLAPGNTWRIAVPSGAECFRSYGGLGYFHGGASLQEWIVPCIEIKWPLSAKPIELRIQPLAQILSLRSKIILHVQRESLFAGSNELPREIEIIVRNQQQKAIFRSQQTLVTPNQEQIAVPIGPVNEAEADRHTSLVIELRDVHLNTVIDTQPTILMVDVENW